MATSSKGLVLFIAVLLSIAIIPGALAAVDVTNINVRDKTFEFKDRASGTPISATIKCTNEHANLKPNLFITGHGSDVQRFGSFVYSSGTTLTEIVWYGDTLQGGYPLHGTYTIYFGCGNFYSQKDIKTIDILGNNKAGDSLRLANNPVIIPSDKSATLKFASNEPVYYKVTYIVNSITKIKEPKGWLTKRELENGPSKNTDHMMVNGPTEITLDGLSPSTTYQAKVRISDRSGNRYTRDEFKPIVFTTLAKPASSGETTPKTEPDAREEESTTVDADEEKEERKAPRVSSIQASSKKGGSNLYDVTITWKTDKRSATIIGLDKETNALPSDINGLLKNLPLRFKTDFRTTTNHKYTTEGLTPGNYQYKIYTRGLDNLEDVWPQTTGRGTGPSYKLTITDTKTTIDDKQTEAGRDESTTPDDSAPVLLPDMTFLNAYVGTAKPIVRSRTNLNARIQNSGQGDADFTTRGAVIKFNSDKEGDIGLLSGSKMRNQGKLKPGEIVTANIPWIPTKEGKQIIFARLDPTGIVTETDERNNDFKIITTVYYKNLNCGQQYDLETSHLYSAGSSDVQINRIDSNELVKLSVTTNNRVKIVTLNLNQETDLGTGFKLTLLPSIPNRTIKVKSGTCIGQVVQPTQPSLGRGLGLTGGFVYETAETPVEGFLIWLRNIFG